METPALPSDQITASVGELLRQAMPRDRKALELHVIALDALRYDLAKVTTDSLQLLYQKRKQMLWPKDAEAKLTELDRTTRLNGDVAVLERDYQFLTRLEDLVASRLNLAMLFLS